MLPASLLHCSHYATHTVDGGVGSVVCRVHDHEREKTSKCSLSLTTTTWQLGKLWQQNQQGTVTVHERPRVPLGHRHGMLLYSQSCYLRLRTRPGTLARFINSKRVRLTVPARSPQIIRVHRGDAMGSAVNLALAAHVVERCSRRARVAD